MKRNQELLNAIYNQFYLAKLDGFFFFLHKDLSNLIRLLYSSLPFLEILPFEEKFSSRKTLNLEKEFLTSLNPEYRKQFCSDYRGRHIISQKGKKGNYYLDLKRNHYKIYYPKTFYIEDFERLTHEYIHHLSTQFPKIREESSSYKVYCEILSLLGELKGLDFLQDLGISKQEIEVYKNNRLKELRLGFEMFLFVEPLLHLFLSNNQLTEKHINELLETNQYYRILGKKDTIYNLNWLLSGNLEKGLSSYVYPLGLVYASSFHQDGISNEEFCKLIQTVNTVEVQEFETMLPNKSSTELIDAIKKEFCLKKRK